MKRLWKHPAFKILAATFVILLMVGLAVNHYFKSRCPLEISYAPETDEIIISPGPFYALDGHKEGEIIPDTPRGDAYGGILRSVSDSDSEYRFQIIRHSCTQYLTVYYHDDLTGAPGWIKFRVNLYSMRFLEIKEESPLMYEHCWQFLLRNK